MNFKALVALIVAATIAVTVTVKVTQKKSDSWQTAQVGGLLFESLPINDAETIIISKGADKLTISKKDQKWVVNERFGYPASFDTISDLAMKLTELKPLRVVEAGKSQLGRLSLLPSDAEESNGTRLEILNKDGKALASLLLGKEYVRQNESARNPMMGGDIPEGRYVLVGNEPPVYLVGETLDNVQTDPKPWLSKDFIKVERLSSVSMQFMGEAAPDWEFTRPDGTGTFQLTNRQESEDVDDSKTRSLASLFSYASFTDVLAPDTATDVTRLNEPSIAVLRTADGFTYTLNIGRLTQDETGRYLKIQVDAELPTERVVGEDEKEEDKARLDKEFAVNLERLQKKLAQEKQVESWIYIVSTWTVENLLRNRIDWMKAEENTEGSDGVSVAPEVSPLVEEVPAMIQRPVEDTLEDLPMPETADEVVEPEGEEIEEGEQDPAEPTGGEDVIVVEDELDPDGE